MPASFGVIDLFAGPGGLGEGFASLDVGGHSPFRIGMSVEKEKSAHRTLTLRAFLREVRRREGMLPSEYVEFHAGRTGEPNWEDVDKGSWRVATTESKCLELGTPGAMDEIAPAIERIHRRFDDTILIGGPPCQAYSLAGRARVRGIPGYSTVQDKRHYLFARTFRARHSAQPTESPRGSVGRHHGRSPHRQGTAHPSLCS